jgi:pimeloyl-ACP methyl ester carboxylesterase
MLPTHWIQNDFTFNGVRLHYYRTGDGSKPALVLVHGFSDDGLCWLQTALDLEANPETVPQLTCPTLIVTADPEKGGIVTPAIAARVKELNPRCTVAHIPGTGHHVRFEDYATYILALRSFLARI